MALALGSIVSFGGNLVAWLLGALGEQRLVQFLERWAEKRALSRATKRALKRFQQHRPDLRDLFDEVFVRGRGATELAQLASRDRDPDPAALAQKFADYFAGKIGPQAFEAASQEFIHLLREEMQAEQVLWPLLNSRAINKIDERTRHLVARPSEADLRDAALELIQGWQRLALLDAGETLIELDLAERPQTQSDQGRIISRDDLIKQLLEGQRFVLYGEPGAGKSTTLHQISVPLSSEGRRVPIAIRLAEWARVAEEDLAVHLASRPQFQRRSASAMDIAWLISTRGILLLDGWNEVEPARMRVCGDRLARLVSDFPGVGIVVTSRPTSLAPLPSATALDLRRLDGARRRQLIMARLPRQEAAELLSRLEWDVSLSELTRTPLLLATTMRLTEEHAAVPASRFGLLRGLIDSAESRSTHNLALRHGPLAGFARDYLEDLAGEMGRSGTTQLTREDACRVVAETNIRIAHHRDESRGSTVDIVDELTAHHLLIRSNVNGEDIIGFIHEQVQEWFGACFAGRQLRQSEAELDGIEPFRELFIDQPAWEQELLLLAEALAEQGDTGIAAGAKLAMLALKIDPVFAGRLARLGGAATWAILRPHFEPRLRAWYQREAHMHRERALAAMVATSQSTFADLIAPLVASGDQQVRLRALRALDGEFSPLVLGEDWREQIRGWPVECRRDLVGELARSADRDAYALVADAARSDPNIDVRLEALKSLAFWGRTEAVTATLEEASPEVWHALIRQGQDWILPEVIQAGLRDTLVALLREESVERPNRVLGALLYLQGHGFVSIDEIASVHEFTRTIDVGGEGAYHLLRELARWDPGAVAARLVAELEAGRGLPSHIDPDLLLNATSEDIDRLFDRALDLQAGRLDTDTLQPVLKALRVEHWRSLMGLFRSLSCEIERSPRGRSREGLLDAYHDAQDLMRGAPAETILGELAGLLSQGAEFPLRAVTGLLAYLATTKDGRISAPDGSRDAFAQFRQAAERLIDLVVATDDPSGARGADMARFLGAFAAPSDLPLLQRLLNRERERLAARSAAFSRRSSPEAQRLIREGAVTWSRWYVEALCALDPPDRDAQLERLLEDPELEPEAAAALIREHRPWADPEPSGIRRGAGYADVAVARERLADAGRREPHPTLRALRDRLSDLLIRNAAGESSSELRRRVLALAERLAAARHPSIAPVVLNALELADPKFSSWMIVGVVKRLVLDGHIVPADRAASLLDAVMDYWLQDKFRSNNDAHLPMKIPCILLYTTSPEIAVPQVRKLLHQARTPRYLLREFYDAAATSGCAAALELLIEFGPERGTEHEWLWAVSRLGGSAAEDAFLTLMLGPTRTAARLDSWTTSAAVADLARRSDRLRQAIFAASASGAREAARRDLLADVLRELASDEAALAGLGLIADADRPPVPRAIERLLEERFVGREPQVAGGSVFNLMPRARPTIRAGLFELLNDPRRRSSALDLLVQLDRWRDEYGRPDDEPRHPDIRSGISWPPL